MAFHNFVSNNCTQFSCYVMSLKTRIRHRELRGHNAASKLAMGQCYRFRGWKRISGWPLAIPFGACNDISRFGKKTWWSIWRCRGCAEAVSPVNIRLFWGGLIFCKNSLKGATSLFLAAVCFAAIPSGCKKARLALVRLKDIFLCLFL